MYQLRSVALLIVFFALSLDAAAQTGTIRGTVRGPDGPLAGVTVRVDGTRLGAFSRSDGSFTIEQVPAGRRTIIGKMLGYAEARQQVNVPTGGAVSIGLTMTEQAVGLKEVQVQANRRRQDQKDTRASVTTIEPREAKYLPGAAEDVLRSLRSLPGVLAPNDFSAQLVVRGSGPDQNLIVLDDIEIFNPYRLYGLISMFNPETVSDITLMTAGFPARYGDRLSAVLDVTNREGERTEALTGKLNASITNANLVLEGALPAGLRGGWLLSGRRTYYDVIAGPILKSLNLLEGDVALPNFQDLQFKAMMRPAPEHTIVLNALVNRDGTELRSSADRTRLDSISILDRSYNWVAGMAWRFAPNDKLLTRTIASWYQNTGETEFGGEGGSQLLYGDISRDSLVRLIRSLPEPFRDTLRARGIDPDNPPALGIDNGRASFNFRKIAFDNRTSISAGRHFLEGGAGVDLVRTSLEFSAQPDSFLIALRGSGRRAGVLDSINSSVDHYRAHAYLQDRYDAGAGVYVQLGGRLDYYGMFKQAYFAPRASFSWAVDPITTVRGAFGVYYQSPGYEKLIDGQTFFDLTSPEMATLRAEKATHYVLGFDRMVTEEWQAKIEGYYKAFGDLIVQKRVSGTKYVSQPIAGRSLRYPSGWTRPSIIAADSTTTIPVNDASGAAYGVELMLQKIGSTVDSRWSGWISYALAWANRIRDGVTYPFSFDQRHTINVVLNYRANDWLELGASFRFGSGYPYTPVTGFHPVIMVRSDSSGEISPRVMTNIFGEAIFQTDRDAPTNSARLPAYHRLDLRATTYAGWWGLDWSFYLDLVNAYNQKNVLSRSSRVNRATVELEQRDVTMLPILPTLGFSVRF